MPVEGRPLRQLVALLAVVVVEQAQLDALRVLREDREVRARPVPASRPAGTAGPARSCGWVPRRRQPRRVYRASGASQITPSGGSVQLGRPLLAVPGRAPRRRSRRRCRRPSRRRRVASVLSTSRQRPGARQPDAVARAAAPARSCRRRRARARPRVREARERDHVGGARRSARASANPAGSPSTSQSAGSSR